jgi:hypothetical protein
VLETSGVDLLSLCHSLSTDECHGILSELRQRWTEVQSLILTAGLSGCRDQLLSEVLSAMEGPAKLVSTVTKLIDPADAPAS